MGSLPPSYTLVLFFQVSGLQRSPVFSLPDVALSACEVVLKPQDCDNTNCGRQSVRLRAVADFFQDGLRWSRIITAPVHTELPLWKSHDPPDVFVSKLHLQLRYSSLCRLFLFHTLLSNLTELFETGTQIQQLIR